MRYPTLELGCGDVKDLRFDYRADIQPTNATNLIADIRDLSRFANNTISYIKLAAVLEHVTPDEQAMAVKEFHRVLVPHGLAWITTPDLEWMRDRLASDPSFQDWFDTLMRGGEKDEYDHH